MSARRQRVRSSVSIDLRSIEFLVKRGKYFVHKKAHDFSAGAGEGRPNKSIAKHVHPIPNRCNSRCF